MSASSGRPCLKPKLSTATCSRESRGESKARTTRSLSWCTLRSVVSITRSAAPRTGSSDRPLHLDRLDETLGVFGQRVEAAGGVVPADELGRRRIEEEHASRRARRRAVRRPCVSTSTCWRPATRASRSMSLLGFAASSTIVPISAVGRLSTTNHPRSSSTSATPDRPAPGQAGDQDDVGHERTLPTTARTGDVSDRRDRRRGRSIAVRSRRRRRYSRRGIADGRRVLGGTFEEAVRRGRLDHPFEHQPGFARAR